MSVFLAIQGSFREIPPHFLFWGGNRFPKRNGRKICGRVTKLKQVALLKTNLYPVQSNFFIIFLPPAATQLDIYLKPVSRFTVTLTGPKKLVLH